MVLLVSFHAVTCVRNHVFITQHCIRLWVHSSILEAGASGGLLQTDLVPGKMLLGKKHWTTSARSSLCPSEGSLQGWVQTAVYLLCPGAELVSQLCLGSGWLHLPELTASTKQLSPAQPQAGSAHALPRLYIEKPKVKSKAEEPGGDEAVLQHSIKSGISYTAPLGLAAVTQTRQTAPMSSAAFIQHKEAAPERAALCASVPHNMQFAKLSKDCC